MAGKPRPRSWVTLDAAYLNQDTIIDLRDAYGPAGPLVFLALILEARIQAGGGGKPGRVTTRHAVVAKTVGTTAAIVADVIRTAVDLELLAHVGGPPAAGTARFHVQLLKRDAWEPKDPEGANRQARHRA